MKRTKFIAATLFILLFTRQVKAQKLVTFDFKSKQFQPGDSAKLQKLKLGDLYQLKITNINTNLYKVSLGKRDSIIHTSLSMPTFGTFGVDVLQSLVGTLSTGNIAGVVSKPAQPFKNIFPGLEYYGIAPDNATKKDLNRIPQVKSPTKAPTIKEIVKAFQSSYETTLKSNYSKLNAVKVRTDDLVNSYYKFLIQAQVEDKTDTATNSFFSTTGLTPGALYSRLNSIRSELNQLNDTVNTANNKYLELTKQYSEDIKNAPPLKASDDQLKATYTAFSMTVIKAIDFVSPDNAMKLVNSVIATVNNWSRSYISLPMQFTKDQNTLVFSIVPRKDDTGLEAYTTSITFPIRKSYFWAVSSGIYISPMYNESYSVQKNILSNDTTYTIKSEKPAKLELGLNAMMRYGSKISKENDVYWQFGFGPGVSISDKIRPRALLGTGLAFGSRSKLVLDIGLIAGYSEHLSVLYTDNSNYQTPPAQITVSRFNTKGYFSLGYLFN